MQVSCLKVVGNTIASNQHMEEAQDWQIHSFFVLGPIDGNLGTL
jgi:hypothetical protein